MAPPDTRERATPTLKDPALLRQKCYIGGDWVDADSGATEPVTDPASGRTIGTMPTPRQSASCRATASTVTALCSMS